MKKQFLKITLAAIAAFQLSAASAQLQLPQPSPHASVTQTVGLTDITIDYSSPGVKGREIWGKVVPYDQLWRAGANSATKITFSKDVTISGTNVPKGTYSLFIIPSKTEWTVILNKNIHASTGDYKQDQDLARIKVTPVAIPMRERLAYTISDFNNEVATIAMEWEKIRLPFNVMLGTNKQAIENIDKTLAGTWSTYNSSARYYLETKDYVKATQYVDQSIALSDQWFNNWVKAQILAGQEKYTEAYKYAQHAKELGDKNPDGFFFKADVEKALEDWKQYQLPGKKKK
jgi:hypothetical protein